MPRLGLVFALLLTLVTGIVLGQLKSVSEPRQRALPVRQTLAVEEPQVMAFYDALNTAIRFGDTTAIWQVIAPSFVDHTAFDPAQGTISTLERYLLSLHHQMPAASLTVTDVIAEGALVAIRLRLVGESPMSISGLEVSQFAGEGYELLRFDGKTVAERWASPLLPPLVDEIGSLDIAESATWIREPRLERVTLQERASWQIERHGGTVLSVDSGSLYLETDPGHDATPSAPLPNGDGRVRLLSPGESVSIPASASFRISSAANDSAVLTWVRILTVGSPSSAMPIGEGVPAGVSIELIAGGSIIGPGTDAFTLTAERIAAAPGVMVEIHPVAQIELLMVETGAVDVGIDDGFAFFTSSNGAFTTKNDPFSLGAGEAFSIAKRAVLGYRVSDEQPSAFWIVTIEPVKNQVNPPQS